MSASRWLILLACPEAAGSHWVNRETNWWIDNRGTDSIVIALTGGTLDWDRQNDRVSTSTDALPARLAAALSLEPVWVDLRWTRGAAAIDRRDPRLPDAFASITATIRQVPKDTLIGEHLREGRRRRAAVTIVLALLITLVLVAVLLQIGLGHSQNQAGARALGQLAALRLPTDPSSGTQLALAAYRADPSDDLARSALGQAFMVRRSTIASRLTPGATDRGGAGDAVAGSADPLPESALITDPEVDVSAFSVADGVVVADDLTGDSPRFEPVPGTGRGDRPLAITGRGRWVVVSDAAGVQAWDRHGHEAPRPLVPSGPGTTVEPTPDGSRVVIATPRPGAEQVTVVPLPGGASSPPVTVPAVGPVWQTADPTYLIARTSPADLQGNHFAVFDARTGALVRSVDPNASVVLNGAATVTGTSTASGDGSVAGLELGNNGLTLSDASTGAPTGQIPIRSTGSIDGPVVTSDTRHVVVPDGTSGQGITPAREVDLTNGQVAGAWLPSASGIDPNTDASKAAGIRSGATSDTTILAVHGSRGTLLDRGSVDTIAFERPPENAYAIAHGVPIGFADGPSAVVVYDNGMTTYQTSDGAIIGNVVFPPGEQFQVAAGNDLQSLARTLTPNSVTGVVTRSDGSPEVRDYAIPTLNPLGTYDLLGAGAVGTPDGGARGTAIQVGRVRDETVILSGGVLSWWSTASHRPIAPPVTVTTDPALATTLALNLNDGLTTGGLHNGPDDAVVLRDPTGVSVFRPGSPTPTHVDIRLPDNSLNLTQMLTNGHMVTVELPGRLVQRDPENGRVVAPPAPVPPSTFLLGSDASGNSVTVENAQSGDLTVSSWNLDTDARAGSFTLPGAVASIFNTIPLRGNLWPIDSQYTLVNLPVDPGQWQSDLCRAQNRDFTPDERAVLPTAISDAAPCPDR